MFGCLRLPSVHTLRGCFLGLAFLFKGTCNRSFFRVLYRFPFVVSKGSCRLCSRACADKDSSSRFQDGFVFEGLGLFDAGVLIGCQVQSD